MAPRSMILDDRELL